MPKLVQLATKLDSEVIAKLKKMAKQEHRTIKAVLERLITSAKGAKS